MTGLDMTQFTPSAAIGPELFMNGDDFAPLRWQLFLAAQFKLGVPRTSLILRSGHPQHHRLLKKHSRFDDIVVLDGTMRSVVDAQQVIAKATWTYLHRTCDGTINLRRDWSGCPVRFLDALTLSKTHKAAILGIPMRQLGRVSDLTLLDRFLME